jgi:hypothetical protein
MMKQKQFVLIFLNLLDISKAISSASDLGRKDTSRLHGVAVHTSDICQELVLFSVGRGGDTTFYPPWQYGMSFFPREKSSVIPHEE